MIVSMIGTRTNTSRGFTIVELLIVIVVIAILATISIVAFNGVQDRANDAAVQSDIRNLAMKVMEYQAINGKYPNGGSTRVFPGQITHAISKEAYDNRVHNLYYCLVSGTANERFSIAARSKSGNIFAFYDGGFGEYSGTFSSSATICPSTNIPTSETGFEFHHGLYYASESNNQWGDWTNG